MSYKETVCPRDCYDTCFMKLLLDSSGRPINVVGDKDNPVTQGFLCPRGVMDIKRAYSHERILYPHRRVCSKISDASERISWDDALNVLVEKLTYVLDQFGSDSILHLDYSGNMGLFTLHLPQRLFSALGLLACMHQNIIIPDTTQKLGGGPIFNTTIVKIKTGNK